jgi:hypothetical protein
MRNKNEPTPLALSTLTLMSIFAKKFSERFLSKSKPKPAVAQTVAVQPAKPAPAKLEVKRPAATPITRPMTAPVARAAAAAVPAAVSRKIELKRAPAAPASKLPGARIAPKLAAPAKRAPAAASAPKLPTKYSLPAPKLAAQQEVAPGCSVSCAEFSSLVQFCVSIPVPNGFTGCTGDTSVCVLSNTENLHCSTEPCTAVVPVIVPNPCVIGETIECSGTVTLDKLYMRGFISVIINLPVQSNDVTDLGVCVGGTTTTGTCIQVSREIVIPVDNLVCIGCNVDCTTILANKLVSISIDDVTPVVDPCGSIEYRILGSAVLNDVFCHPPTITTSIHCETAGSTPDALHGYTFQLFDSTNTVQIGTDVGGVVSDQLVVFGPLNPNLTYNIRILDFANNLVVPPSPFPVFVGMDSVVVDPFVIDCLILVEGTITCETGGSLAAGYVVNLYDALLNQIDSMTAGADGNFTLYAPFAGSYTVEVKNLSSNTVFFTNYPAVTGPSPFVLGPVNIDCNSQLTGTVDCTDGSPVDLAAGGFTWEIATSIFPEVIVVGPVAFVGGPPNPFSASLAPGSYFFIIRDSGSSVYVSQPFTMTAGMDINLSLSISCGPNSNLSTIQGCSSTCTPDHYLLYDGNDPGLTTPVSATIGNSPPSGCGFGYTIGPVSFNDVGFIVAAYDAVNTLLGTTGPFYLTQTPTQTQNITC